MSNDDPPDPLFALRAEIDQMLAVAPELTRTYRGWFESFQREGFTDQQALYLASVQMTQNPGKAP